MILEVVVSMINTCKCIKLEKFLNKYKYKYGWHKQYKVSI